MVPSILDQVVDFYNGLFGRIFLQAFQSQIANRIRRNEVKREVEAAADAASSSLVRFFESQRQNEAQVAAILSSITRLVEQITLANIAHANATPEALVTTLLGRVGGIEPGQQQQADATYRVVLHSVIQILTLVGPVMDEWQRLSFSSTFELPRRVTNRLNDISAQLDAQGLGGQDAADERFELAYRDYLMQRFYRVEAGTVRMTTNLAVDLGELFVMPRVLPQRRRIKNGVGGSNTHTLMKLAEARSVFGSDESLRVRGRARVVSPRGVIVLTHIKKQRRNILIGAPGSGKSTFLEWLQLKVASGEEVLITSGKQAIPLLLRVRQLDPHNLPLGAALIEQATASKDLAAIMPAGWIERQMKNGRVLFMLDGLDEVDPMLRDSWLIPWLGKVRRKHPKCQYLVSSRPVGYAPDALHALQFTACDLLDFNGVDIEEYTRHWCIAVRLARNELEEEARREGAVDGKRIVEGFEHHPYIYNLARNPLMLSAICLVNYFEGGQLPKDRAILYKLCVEGLLHYWDQRRGIHSEFTLSEKLRVCREVALAMQAEDRAEYEAEKVRTILIQVLHDTSRADVLLEHIRYRTGLLLERRPNTFAFAHLTFQEYLAACAIYEGNQLNLAAAQLVDEHDNGRWNEVIALYCGLVPASASRTVIERIIDQADTNSLAGILADAYLSASPDLAHDVHSRERVLERIAITSSRGTGPAALNNFPDAEVAPVANRCLGTRQGTDGLSAAYGWLRSHRAHLDVAYLTARLLEWHAMTPIQMSELMYLLHAFGPDTALTELARHSDLYRSPGPVFSGKADRYDSQAEIVVMGLMQRMTKSDLQGSVGFTKAFVQALRGILTTDHVPHVDLHADGLRHFPDTADSEPEILAELAMLLRQLAELMDLTRKPRPLGSEILGLWGLVDSLERTVASRLVVAQDPGQPVLQGPMVTE